MTSTDLRLLVAALLSLGSAVAVLLLWALVYQVVTRSARARRRRELARRAAARASADAAPAATPAPAPDRGGIDYGSSSSQRGVRGPDRP